MQDYHPDEHNDNDIQSILADHTNMIYIFILKLLTEINLSECYF